MDGTFLGKIGRAQHGEIEDYGAWKDEVQLKPAAFPSYCNQDPLADAFFTRMLYSCLVDADYLDTELFMEGTEPERGGGDCIGVLKEKLDAYIADWFPPSKPLNEKRCEILEACITQGKQKKPGAFTLTVPTGGGKTVASFAFALHHAEVQGMRRIIYVVPYTSIIEQTAEKFREILGNENVLEHHSGVIYEASETSRPENIRLMHATENWDMPVIVTTAVQFFESLFANGSSKCRKLHNIAQSVIVFDEAQMLPISYLKPCVHAITQLVRNYGVSAVLCSATQPALGALFQSYGCVTEELCPKELAEDPIFKRVKIQQRGVLGWETVAELMNERQQILCIVNSRKNAQAVFSMLQGEGCFHLSTLMIPEDRLQQLNEIRSRLKHGLPCRVVATSLIEAGVDVDFPTVMREEAGLDSILQAAGRCNREGERPLEESVVIVFRPETKPPRLFSTNITAGRVALEQYADPTDAKIMECYFRELLALKGDKALDKNDILGQLGNGSFPFQSVAEQFHLIDNGTATLYIPIGEGKALLERYRSGERSKQLMRKLGRYGVNIYDTHCRALYDAGDIVPLDDGSYYLVDLGLYNSKTGLSLEADSGRAEFV
jgi:CRISPR-associated endonuclease/helicase Cas3